ncbi:MAG: hypothetical protein EHM45_08310 [Desulfobacteraceae bacterium]|nr:MAG: hypothetical protein EHM45_08310 [Desulfobacteraceae bacterium]
MNKTVIYWFPLCLFMLFSFTSFADTTKNTLIIPFDKAGKPVQDKAKFSFLLDAIDTPDKSFTRIDLIEMGFKEGPLLFCEYQKPYYDPQQGITQLIVFLGNMKQGYRQILSDLYLFVGPYKTMPSSQSEIYINDLDGDGIKEILSFEIDGTVERLGGIYSFRKDLGIFVIQDNVESGNITLEKFKDIRNKNPINLHHGYTYGSADLVKSRWLFKPSTNPTYIFKDPDSIENAAQNNLTRFNALHGHGVIHFNNASYKIMNQTADGIFTAKVSASATSLKPGIYSFFFNFINNQGAIDKITELSLKIEDPKSEPKILEIIPDRIFRADLKKYYMKATTIDTVSLTWTEYHCFKGCTKEGCWVLEKTTYSP